MKRLPFALLSALIVILASSIPAYAVSTFIVQQGGTGSTSPSGILTGDNGATNHVNTLNIGANLTYTPGTNTLSASGGSGSPGGSSGQLQYNGSGSFAGVATTTVTVGNGLASSVGTTFSVVGGADTTLTSTLGTTIAPNELVGQGSFTTNQLLGVNTGTGTFFTNATTSATCSGTVSCTSFTVLGAAPITITGSGGGGSFPFSADTNYGQVVYSTSTPTLWFKSGVFASSTSQFVNASTTLLTVSRQGVFQPPVSGSTANFVGVDGAPLRITFDTHGAGTSGTALMFRNSGGTAAAPTATISGAVLGSFNGRGYGTTGYAAGSTGLVTLKAAGLFTDTSMPTVITFDTTPTNSVTAVERVRVDSTGNLGVGTTTPFGKLSVHANNGETNTSLFNIGSSTATATSTLFNVMNTGNVGIGTSTPFAPLSVVGNIMQYGASSKFGTANPLFTCAAQSCLELWGDDNTTAGVQASIGNRNAGTSAYSGLNLYTSDANSNLTNFAGIYKNGPFYSDITFGSGVNIANQFLVQNTLGPVSFVTSTTSASNAYFNWLTNATGSSDEKMRLTSPGFLGLASTTPWAQLSVNPLVTNGAAPAFAIGSSTGTSFVVTNTGRVGIGTSTPSAKLAIEATAGNSTTSPLVAIGSSTANNVSIFNTVATRVGIGATSTPSYTLSVEGTVGLHGLTTSASTQGSAICGKEVTGGELIAESIACLASAKRYKTDIQDLHVGLDELMQLRPVSFLWGKEYNQGFENDPNKNSIQYSLIADEVQAVDPRLAAVTTATTTYGGAEYAPGTVQGLADVNHWVALFVKSIQEVVARISGLEEKVQKQQQEIDSLTARLDALEKN